MPTLDLTNSWSDGAVFYEADLDNIKDGLETFLNTTKLDGDNIQDGIVTPSLLAAGAVTVGKLDAVGEQVSSATGSFTTSSTSYVDITNATVTITTTGRPVILLLQHDGSTSEGSVGCSVTGNRVCEIAIQILRDSTEISINEVELTTATTGTNSMDYAVSQIYHVDQPAAGTYTYKAQVKAAAGTANVTNAKLSAYEL